MNAPLASTRNSISLALYSFLIDFNNESILEASPSRKREIRGNEISMIFQDPMTALNPRMTVIVDEFLGFVGQIPEFLLDTDEIWWNGHADSILRVSEDKNFEWYCEAEIRDDLDEDTFNSILSDLLERKKHKQQTESIKGKNGLFLLHDEYFEDEDEKARKQN